MGPEGFGVDGQPLQEGSDTRRVYMDPFRSHNLVFESDLASQLKAMGVASIEHEGHLGIASTADMIRRAARNIIRSIQSTRHAHDLSIPAESLYPDSDGALYSALWALLVLPEDHTPRSAGARYLPYILDHIEKQFLIDVRLIEKFTIPLFMDSPHQEQLRNTIRVMRAGDLMPKPVKSRRNETSQSVRYKVGQAFRHRSVEDKSVRYVAEENIDDGLVHVGVNLMSLAGQHFKRWDKTSKAFVSNIRDEYPDD
ncbi:MAG: hypothetical protein Q9224_000496 [Gallowayella concinna]